MCLYRASARLNGHRDGDRRRWSCVLEREGAIDTRRGRKLTRHHRCRKDYLVCCGYDHDHHVLPAPAQAPTLLVYAFPPCVCSKRVLPLCDHRIHHATFLPCFVYRHGYAHTKQDQSLHANTSFGRLCKHARHGTLTSSQTPETSSSSPPYRPDSYLCSPSLRPRALQHYPHCPPDRAQTQA